jgi:hypothetical protein
MCPYATIRPLPPAYKEFQDDTVFGPVDGENPAHFEEFQGSIDSFRSLIFQFFPSGMDRSALEDCAGNVNWSPNALEGFEGYIPPGGSEFESLFYEPDADGDGDPTNDPHLGEISESDWALAVDLFKTKYPDTDMNFYEIATSETTWVDQEAVLIMEAYVGIMRQLSADLTEWFGPSFWNKNVENHVNITEQFDNKWDSFQGVNWQNKRVMLGIFDMLSLLSSHSEEFSPFKNDVSDAVEQYLANQNLSEEEQANTQLLLDEFTREMEGWDYFMPSTTADPPYYANPHTINDPDWYLASSQIEGLSKDQLKGRSPIIFNGVDLQSLNWVINIYVKLNQAEVARQRSMMGNQAFNSFNRANHRRNVIAQKREKREAKEEEYQQKYAEALSEGKTRQRQAEQKRNEKESATKKASGNSGQSGKGKTKRNTSANTKNPSYKDALRKLSTRRFSKSVNRSAKNMRKRRKKARENQRESDRPRNKR